MCNLQYLQNINLLCIVLLLLLGCQSKKEVSTLKNETTVEEYDLSPMFLAPSDGFGRFEAAHDFYYKNDTAEEIVLTLESTSCGCTRAKIVPERIAPGEKATISLAYDLAYTQESRSETIIVKTNQKPPKQFAYRLKVVTFPRLEIIRTDYSEIVCDPGKTTSLTILCRSYRSKTENPNGQMILQSSPWLLNVHSPHGAEAREAIIDNIVMSEKTYSLELLSPSASDSKYDNNGYSALLILKNDEYQVNTSIKWKPKQYIDADKTTVFFNCMVDSIEDEQVTLKSKDEFAITSIQTEHGLCEVQCDLQQSSRQHQVKVSTNIKSIPDTFSANKDVIILSTDHPLQPQVRLDVHLLLPFRE